MLQRWISLVGVALAAASLQYAGFFSAAFFTDGAVERYQLVLCFLAPVAGVGAAFLAQWFGAADSSAASRADDRVLLHTRRLSLLPSWRMWVVVCHVIGVPLAAWLFYQGHSTAGTGLFSVLIGSATKMAALKVP